ncbi:MAG: T9SS type A sorting domain-containing protein [Bacteroidetes bacterium]|nr:T9SS type A sorting domain-containing protein [Bacteroidota bacterium]
MIVQELLLMLKIKIVLETHSKQNGIAIKTNLTAEVFPNPVHTILKIKSENLERIQRLELISIEGRKRNYPIIQDGDKIAVDLTNLISGIYTLVFIDRENQIISRTKLIKNNLENHIYSVVFSRVTLIRE